MKPFFTLRLLLSAVCFVFCSFNVLAQEFKINGPTTVCPNTTVRYTFNHSGCANINWGPVQNLGYTIIGQGAPVGGLPYVDIQFTDPATGDRTGTLNAGYSCSTYNGNASLQITVRHVTVINSSTIDIPCNFSGNREFVFNDLPTDSYANETWTTNTGWPIAAGPSTGGDNHGLTTTRVTYNVNNLNAGTVNITYGNRLCPSSAPSQHTYTITRSTSNALPAPPVPGGPSFMCAGATANMGTSPYPNATSYTWTSNAPSVKINGQTPPVTITAANGGNNVTVTSPTPVSANITVQVQSSCGQSLPATGHINIGVLPAPTQLYVNGTLLTQNEPLELQRFSENIISIDPVPNATSYLWSLSSNLLIQSGQGTQQLDIIVNGSAGQSISIAVQGKNSCATGAGFDKSGQITGDGGVFSTFDVYPNPATSNIAIKGSNNSRSAVANNKLAKVAAQKITHDIRQVNIYDNAGKQVKSIRYPRGTTQVNIPVNTLLPGIYYVEIISDVTERRKIIIQR